MLFITRMCILCEGNCKWFQCTLLSNVYHKSQNIIFRWAIFEKLFFSLIQMSNKFGEIVRLPQAKQNFHILHWNMIWKHLKSVLLRHYADFFFGSQNFFFRRKKKCPSQKKSTLMLNIGITIGGTDWQSDQERLYRAVLFLRFGAYIWFFKILIVFGGQ